MAIAMSSPKAVTIRDNKNEVGYCTISGMVYIQTMETRKTEMTEILQQAATELSTLNLRDGRIIHGWHRRYRNLLTKAGMDRNEAIYALSKIERA